MKKTHKYDFMTGRFSKPDGRQAALLLLRLIDSRNSEREKPMTRIRLAEVTLKRLWNREQFSDRFLAEVGDWLLSAGWVLFFAGSTFAAAQTSAVLNWPSVSSKRIRKEIEAARRGELDFNSLEHLFSPTGDDQDEDGQHSEDD